MSIETERLISSYIIGINIPVVGWYNSMTFGSGLQSLFLFSTPASAVEVIESIPSVCMCVCLSVCERSHGRTVWRTEKKFTWWSVWTISWSSSMSKVIGQKSSSRGQKRDFMAFGLGLQCTTNTAYFVTSWRLFCEYLCQSIMANDFQAKGLCLGGNAGGFVNVTTFSFFLFFH